MALIPPTGSGQLSDDRAETAGTVQRHRDSSVVVSVVVPAKNASKTIDACLAAIERNVPRESCEVIVADNGSTDGTREIAARRRVRVVRVPQGFVSRVRNQGAAEARGSILAFVDSDCLVQRGWYEAVTTLLSDAATGIAGCRHEIPEGGTWCQQVWHDAQLRRETIRRDAVLYVPAGNCAVRRDVFLSVGGFDEKLETGEDPDLCSRIAALGLRVVTASSMRNVHLGEPPALIDVFRRERWHGRGVRLTYSNGRIAPIMTATLMFAALLTTGTCALVGVPLGAPVALALALPLAFMVPLSFALRYQNWANPWQCCKLWIVYCVYFLGRAAALPVALRRAWS